MIGELIVPMATKQMEQASQLPTIAAGAGFKPASPGNMSRSSAPVHEGHSEITVPDRAARSDNRISSISTSCQPQEFHHFYLQFLQSTPMIYTYQYER